MKKIFCLAIILLSAVCIFAQETIIEKSDFDAALKNRFRQFAGQSYRLTTSAEDFRPETDKSASSWKSVMEFTGLGLSRSLFEFNSPTLKTRTEILYVKGKTYIRKNDGEWEEKSSSGENDKPSSAARKFVVVEEQTEYKSLGTQILDNLNASVYAKIERKKIVNEPEKRELFLLIVTKYWLDEKGGIIKEETETENLIKSESRPDAKPSRQLRTAIWELDPNIKIEAPVPAR